MLPDILLYLVPLPFLIIASWQDIKHRSITVSILIAVALAGFVSLSITGMSLSLIYPHILFCAVFLLLGLGFQEVKAWCEGDTILLGIIAFIVPPIDYFMFFMVIVASLGAFTIPMVLKKTKTFIGVPALTLVWILYLLVI